MFAVVQFIENRRFQVLAVPDSWIKKNNLMWPKLLSKEKLEKLRREGSPYSGSVKEIPVIVSNKFRHFEIAEAEAERLAKREVSDIEEKKKRLVKKPRPAASKDYETLCETLTDGSEVRGYSKRKTEKRPNLLLSTQPVVPTNPLPPTVEQPIELEVLLADSPYTTKQARNENIPNNGQTNSIGSSNQENHYISSLSAFQSPMVTPVQQSKSSRKLNHANIVQTQSKQPSIQTFVYPPDSRHGTFEPLPENEYQNPGMYQPMNPGQPQEAQPVIQEYRFESMQLPPHTQAKPDDQLLSAPSGQTGMHQTQPAAPVYYENDTIYISTPAEIEDGSALLTYGAYKLEMDALRSEIASLKEEVVALQRELRCPKNAPHDNNIESVVKRCFEDNFAKLASVMEIKQKPSKTSHESETPVENHQLITTEVELNQWNAQLADESFGQEYIEYFSKIIHPNTYCGKGDNACYTIVDCLFTREFWNLFTWTGINRGNKSKRGFREFGNVIQLIVNLARIGDSSYNMQKFETFCKTRLFRYSKARASNRQLRKSACRPGRKRKATDVDAALAAVKVEILEGSNDETDGEEAEHNIEAPVGIENDRSSFVDNVFHPEEEDGQDINNLIEIVSVANDGTEILEQQYSHAAVDTAMIYSENIKNRDVLAVNRKKMKKNKAKKSKNKNKIRKNYVSIMQN